MRRRRGAAPPGPHEVQEEIGARIAQFRRARSWRQRDLAARAATRVHRLSLLENGHSLPTVHELLRLRAAFDVSLDELVTGTPPAPPLRSAALLRGIHEVESLVSAEDLRMMGRVFAGLVLLINGQAAGEGDASRPGGSRP